jgi:hypothetical protein
MYMCLQQLCCWLVAAAAAAAAAAVLALPETAACTATVVPAGLTITSPDQARPLLLLTQHAASALLWLGTAAPAAAV